MSELDRESQERERDYGFTLDDVKCLSDDEQSLLLLSAIILIAWSMNLP